MTMASIFVTSDRRIRVQVRTRGFNLTRYFETRQEGEIWAEWIELQLRRGDQPPKDWNKTEQHLRYWHTQTAHIVPEAVDEKTTAEPVDIPIETQVVWQPPTFAAVLVEYRRKVTRKKKSVKTESQMVHQLLGEDWVDIPLGELKRKTLVEWRDKRLEEVSASTVSRHFDVIKHAAKIAVHEWDWAVDRAVFDVKVVRPAQKPVERVASDVSQLLVDEAAEAQVWWLKPVIELALQTGLRRSEICRQKRSDCNLGNDPYIIVRDTKNGETREVSLTPAAKQLVKDVISNHKVADGTLFGINADQLTQAWKRLRKRCGLEGQITFHQLRHEAVSSFHEWGLTPIEVASMSGHKTMSQVMRYSHAARDKISAKLKGEEK